MANRPVVIVTGASKGIGLAVTKILLTEFHATVVSLSRSTTPELEQLAQAHSDNLLVIPCDVTDVPAVDQAVSATLQKYQHIDGLVLNAATLEPMGKIASPDISLDAWKHHFDVNVFSLVTTLRATLPELRKSGMGGKVVFVSSGSATGGTAGWGPYNASKAALNSLCRTLAQEEPEVVSVAVRPGRVDTAMQGLLRSAGKPHMKLDDYQKYATEHENGKLIKPEDPGYVIAALAIRASSTLSGQFVIWDGEECTDYRKQ